MIRSKEEVLKDFKPENINFQVDMFEELIIKDLMANGNTDLINKLKRDLTNKFNDWLINNYNQKRQTKINIKGGTRDGKSLVGIKIIFTKGKLYGDKDFDMDKIVCANQRVLRQKLKDCEFGDLFLVDENAFANVGAGSMTELQQLKDINNITAKNNNTIIYITPKAFLDTGATIGLATWGRDSNNWLTRMLLYSLKSSMPQLLGHVIFDLNQLFIENGCLIYKQIGGCTNPNRLSVNQIKQEYIHYSDCIPKDYDESQITQNNKQCPFYNICKSQMNRYEHIKDDWIKKEFQGGLSEREHERYLLSLQIFQELAHFNEEGKLRLKARNGKEIKLKVKLKLPLMSNAKFTGLEVDEICQLVISLVDRDFFNNLCNSLELDENEEFSKIK